MINNTALTNQIIKKNLCKNGRVMLVTPDAWVTINYNPNNTLKYEVEGTCNKQHKNFGTAYTTTFESSMNLVCGAIGFKVCDITKII